MHAFQKWRNETADMQAKEHRDRRTITFSTKVPISAGSTLFIENEIRADFNTMRRATRGGAIRINYVDYAMIAGHAFANTPLRAATFDHSDAEMQFSESDDDSDILSYPSNASVISDLEMDRIKSLKDLESALTPFRVDTDSEQFTTARQEIQLLHNLSKIGDLAFSSSDGSHAELEYAFILLCEQPASASSDSTGYPTHFTREDLSSEDNIQVVANTASEGSIVGVAISTPTFMRAPSTAGYQETYSILLEQPLSNGDCSSWVHETSSGKLYGHITAGSPNTGPACVVSAYQIFEDIERQKDLIRAAVVY